MENLITHKINHLTDRMNSLANSVLIKEFSITYSEFLVLNSLQYHQTLSQQQIASCTNYSKGFVSRVVFKLEERSLIEIKIDKEDRRNRNLSLTKSGKNIIQKSSRYLERLFFKKSLSKLSQKQIQSFDKILDILLDAIQS